MLKEILIYLLLLIFPQKDEYFKEFNISIEYIPQYIYWIDDINILISGYGNTEIYNISERKSKSIQSCDTCIYGYDKGFVYCKYEHFQIKSLDEFSTRISVYDMKDNLLYSKEVFPTVIPSFCSRSKVILLPAYSFLEQKEYILKNEGREFSEYISKKEEIYFKGIPDTYLSITPRKDSEILILVDTNFEIWVYKKKTLFL